MQELKDILSHYRPISLEEMDSVALMKRMDTKFVVPVHALLSILEELKNSYKILEINSNRLMTYNSTYFDTEDFNLYKDHHNQRKTRIKVRVREYLETNVRFIEIKRKSNKGITNKSRRKINGEDYHSASNAFTKEITQKNLHLKKSMTNSFNRITLVNTELKERITMDTNIEFDNALWNKNLAIIELKQEKLKRMSPLYALLRKRHIKPLSVSKYCLGMSTIRPQLKKNNFKQIFRNIHKVIQ